MSLSVIELAQLLTGALDEKFNIKNQSAVVKVVAWLEAFNITHESYREVQNTRIIKDLQALRQNKANDQALAKRIKNLLRKWKERLAAAPTNSSQPNSPQNFSQGSSDTQFMTQKSQSPPNIISNISNNNNNSSHHAPATSRIVNGPTSFKNLLPKSQNYPTTSPALQNHNNLIPHIHQNGGIDSSVALSMIGNSKNGGGMFATSAAPATGVPTSLLGKRKMPSSSIDINNSSNSNNNNNLSIGGDIDENSNHNRRKMMRKTNSGLQQQHLQQQPLTSNANSNSNISNNTFHLNNNQQQQISKSITNVPQQNLNNLNNNVHQKQISPPQIILQQQQNPPPLQQQQQPPLQPQLKVEEQPKPKRGRRKGSKGIDSMLNGNIPDFQAEIKQKLALSTGRRNKTTFELQQMLESHQNSQMSWTNGDVPDSASLDRVNNFTTSSSYMPAEPSHNNNNNSIFDEIKIKKDINTESFDEQLPSTSSLKQQPKTAAESLRSLTIEDEIAKLQALLPPIDYVAAARYHFREYETYDENDELVECTCTFREVITYDDPNQSEQQQIQQQQQQQSNGHNNAVEVKLNGDIKKPHDSEEDDDDDDETDDFCAVEDDVEQSPPPQQMRSAVKSIFDPEYDANENLIDEMVRQKPRSGIPKVIEVKIEKDAVKSSRIESMLTVPESIQHSHVNDDEERVPIINYVCDEDPMCPARAHFQRDPVTDYDVKHLHNSFLHGVNGNWNGVDEEAPEQDYTKDAESIDYEKNQLWKRVVPRYNFLTLDKVPKTFDDDSPFSIPPPPIKKEKNDDDDNEDGDKESKSKNQQQLSFNDLFSTTTTRRDNDFREWHEVMNVRSYNDEILTILPYVVID